MNATVKRSIFGAIFLVIMLGGLLWHQDAFFFLFLFISARMLHEFYRMNMGESCSFLQDAGIAFGIVLFSLAFYYFKGDLQLVYFTGGALLGLILLLCLSVLQKDHVNFPKLAYILAGLVYVAVPLAFSNAVVFRSGAFSGILMIAFFCIIWASDIGAYCFGMLIGQKLWPAKMCPSISPKKSWAGFIGGLLMAVLAGAVISMTGMVAFPIWHCMIMAALMHVTGVFGDLFESLWKRAAGIKDSGNLIPGHGGLLDRFDSSLFAIPTGVVYLILTGLF